jgi:hypothetical protein
MTNSRDIKLHQGKTSVLVSVPHSGTGLPEVLHEQMTAEARQLPDTDWFVDRLYNWVTELDVSFIVAPWSRYVIEPTHCLPVWYRSIHFLGTLFIDKARRYTGRRFREELKRIGSHIIMH